MARIHSCNVVQAAGDRRHLWQFSAAGKFNLLREETKSASQPFSPGLVGKDWQALFQPKLNVAWLPADKVFLRAVQLPKADFAETQSMVELQLEKISPLPVAQVVWTFEVLPQGQGEKGDMQTVVVIVVPRNVVEEFLGTVQTSGFLPDRLELPLLDQLAATRIDGNGVWIYPEPGGLPQLCMVAWWYDHVLQNLSLVTLPLGERRAELMQSQLAQMVWGGELEGWITETPRYHLVAEGQTAENWRALLGTDQPVEVVPPSTAREVAAMTAKRAVSTQPRMNLLPPEYTAQYKQQFVDRLWMRGLGAMLLLYILGIAIYFGLVQFSNWQLGRVEDQLQTLGPSYTNALQLKEQVKVLQDQVDLQFAALDCYKAVAEFLPPELTLDTVNFERGRKLTLTGTAPNDTEGVAKVQSFNEALRNAKDRTQSDLFNRVTAPNISPRPGTQLNSWTFSADLKRSDT